MLNYGQRPLTPVDIELGSQVPAAAKFSHDWQLTVSEATSLLGGAEQRYTAAERREKEAVEDTDNAKRKIELAQDKQKKQADKKRSLEPVYQIGQEVLLCTKNVKLKNPGARKLLPLWIGPAVVIGRVGKVAYKLKLDAEIKMHPVFHLNLLKGYIPEKHRVPPPSASLLEGYLEYEAEQIISYDSRRKKYLVKWLGYGQESNTWEPEKHLKNATDLVQEYWDMVRVRDAHKGKDKRLRGRQPENEDLGPEQPVRKSARLEAKKK